MDAMSSAVIELAQTHNFDDWRIIGTELKVRGKCPICNGGNSGDTNTFSINVATGAWNCLRGSCTGINGKHEGNFKDLCSFFGVEAPSGYSMPRRTQAQKKVYAKPDPSVYKPLTDKIVNYFATRKISEETLMDWGICSDEHGNIVFPFYRDRQLVFVKYREPRKFSLIKEEYENKLKNATEVELIELKKHKPVKEWRMANTESILFGMDMVSFNKPLVITEGQMDCLALYEAGVSNVVSVPSGCEDMNWISNCWEWLENFNQIILFGDADEPGLEMVSTLSKRLGEDRCMIPREYPEFIYNGVDYNRICKDANEILTCYGPEYLKELVDSCEPAPIKGVLDLASIPFIDPTTVPRIMTRIPQLDHMIGGLSEGGITIVSGKRAEGKSTLSGPILLSAIEQGYPVCAYSGELSSYKFLEWIMLQATESKYIAYKTDVRSGKNICYVEEDIQKRIKSWLSGKFFLYDNSIVQEEKQTESILKIFEACARRYGCKVFLVDNLMSALCSPDEENKAQARFTAQLKAFANKYKAHVIMVAHPRKERADQVFTNDSISGSSAISNLADNVINVEKSPKGIRVTKNRDFGLTGFIPTCYDPANRRIYQASTGDKTIYSWDHNGIKLPENPASTLEEFKPDDGVDRSAQNQPF